ncbi:MAG TPA: hypothetical protein VLA80_09490 [Actinomycetota bacterium]|nr:hypothetical protein [Actinomycetota bacterium]
MLEAGRTRVGPSIGLGLLLFFGLPVLAVLALARAVGIPLGPGPRPLGRPRPDRLGGRVPGRLGHPAPARSDPDPRRLVWFAAVVFGLGALAVATWRARTTSPAAAPARA